jgi:hypothetical protein
MVLAAQGKLAHDYFRPPPGNSSATLRDYAPLGTAATLSQLSVLHTERLPTPQSMGNEHKEALQVVETVKLVGRIFEDARNHIWYVPTQHPVFSALAMVASFPLSI